jgi:hypothetical protein
MIDVTSMSTATRREMRDLVTATTTLIATTGLGKECRIPRCSIKTNHLVSFSTRRDRAQLTSMAGHPAPLIPCL